MKILSLFSGAGGLDLGLILAGNEIVWANDNDKNAVATYKKNIGEHIVLGDITTIDTKEMPNCDVVVGGFPCQGFSQANRFRFMDDQRNILYKQFYRVILEKQPKYFIAENVKGILSLGKGQAIRQILEDFKDAGYNTEVHLVNMANYGVPETRQRVIIVGQRNDLSEQQKFIFPAETHNKTGDNGLKKWVSIKEAIDLFPDPDKPNTEYNHDYSKYKVEYRNYTAHRKTDPDKPSPTILARGNGGGGVCAIPHYNGIRRLTVRESAAVQTFPRDFEFIGSRGSCYRQVGNAVPVLFARQLGDEFIRLENKK
ncbi:DNA cytosine methyltransferase [Candidatus Saccharibacteria bacterium]|nr:DNA cytosine methyltransferase [Candidatus Saccharibacteria bacterium]